MSKYEDLKYVLSGATDWGYEYAKKEDVEAAFAELEERHAMELDRCKMKCDELKAFEVTRKALFGRTCTEKAYLKSEVDAVIADLKKEVSRQKRLRCYNLKMWCSAERFTHRGRTIPEEGRWWERHFYSVCRLWERLKEAV